MGDINYERFIARDVWTNKPPVLLNRVYFCLFFHCKKGLIVIAEKSSVANNNTSGVYISGLPYICADINDVRIQNTKRISPVCWVTKDNKNIL